MPISRALRNQMLSDLLSNPILLTLSSWPLVHNVAWVPQTSRSCTDLLWPGSVFYLSISVLYICVCPWVCTCLSALWYDTYQPALPSNAQQNNTWWQQLRYSFPISQASTRDLSLALCKQEAYAHSALSTATVMHATLSHETQQTPQPCRRRWMRTIIGWPYHVICNTALKGLFYREEWPHIYNKIKAIIHLIVFFFSLVLLEYICTEKEKTLLKDRILIFNALQLY